MSQKIEDGAIYITLRLRGTPGSFHWGIVVISEASAPSGNFYHATNASGGWMMQVRTTKDPSKSQSTVLLYRIGTITPSTAALCDNVLRSVIADGTPSARTGEAFTCRIWFKDAVMKLHEAKVVKLSKDIDTIEAETRERATKLEPAVERGTSQAEIIN